MERLSRDRAHPGPIRCAIYTRASDRYFWNKSETTEAQRSACERYLQSMPGWIALPERYDDDKEASGLDFERPAFLRLMADIRSRSVTGGGRQGHRRGGILMASKSSRGGPDGGPVRCRVCGRRECRSELGFTDVAPGLRVCVDCINRAIRAGAAPQVREVGAPSEEV